MTWKEELDALIAKVEANATVKASVNALLNGLSDIAAKVKDDAGAVQAFADSLKAKAPAAADAVVANTPKPTA